jgi:hypothetical protein
MRNDYNRRVKNEAYHHGTYLEVDTAEKIFEGEDETSINSWYATVFKEGEKSKAAEKDERRGRGPRARDAGSSSQHGD